MFKHILVLIEALSHLDQIRDHAVNIARMSGASITLLRLLNPDNDKNSPQFVDPLDWNIRKLQAEASLNEIAAPFKAQGLSIDTAILDSLETESLLQYVQSHPTSLIILPKRTQYMSDWAYMLMKETDIPLLIVPTNTYLLMDDKPLCYQKIFVPLDGSQRAEVALSLASALAHFCGAQIILAHAIRKPEMPRRGPLTPEESGLAERIVESNHQEAARYLEQLAERISGDVLTRIMINDNIAATLQRSAEQEGVDLIVMSAHGYTGEAWWPHGSITGSFIAYSRKPTLVIQDLPVRRFRQEDEWAIRDSRMR